MADDVFISYSRRDQEFVIRLAEDLNRKVSSGVWFDQSDIQAGQKWRDEIAAGVKNCKAFILVLSPDSIESKYVQMETNLALEQGKTILPIIYRAVKSLGNLEELVHETQTIDLRAGSYADNFKKLVDGLLAAGVSSGVGGERPFLRERAKTDWGAVISKIPGWAAAWGLGWALFWLVIFLALWIANRDSGSTQLVQSLLASVVSGGVGGLVGGLLAGSITMLALRRNAPSIGWKHMAPGVRIWALSGTVSIIISAIVGWIMLSGFSPAGVNCEGLGIVECLGSTFVTGLASTIGFILVLAVLVLFIAIAIWFITGVVAGWLAVRHIRRLEPGIGRSQAVWTALGWGLGSLLGAFTSLSTLSGLTAILGLD